MHKDKGYIFINIHNVPENHSTARPNSAESPCRKERNSFKEDKNFSEAEF